MDTFMMFTHIDDFENNEIPTEVWDEFFADENDIKEIKNVLMFKEAYKRGSLIKLSELFRQFL